MIVQCDKCGGSGYIHAFAHVVGGQCFKCLGSGVIKGSAVQNHTFPIPTKEDALYALNDDYAFDIFTQKFNMSPYQALREIK